MGTSGAFFLYSYGYCRVGWSFLPLTCPQKEHTVCYQTNCMLSENQHMVPEVWGTQRTTTPHKASDMMCLCTVVCAQLCTNQLEGHR